MAFPTFSPQDVADILNAALANVDSYATTLGITEDKPGAINMMTLLFLSGMTTASQLADAKAQAAQQSATSTLNGKAQANQTLRGTIQTQAAAILP